MKFRLIFAALLLVIFSWVGWWAYHHYRYVYEDHPVAPKGQAVYDPLYAASLVLKAYGVRTVVQPYLDMKMLAPSIGDTLVYYGDLRTLTPEQVSALENWVFHAGGHLLVQLPADSEPGDIPLLDHSGFHIVPASNDCPRFSAGPEDKHPTVLWCRGNAIKGSADEYRYAAGPDGALFYAQQDWGKGWISVFSSMGFMDNGGLIDETAQHLLLRVLRPERGGRVLLIYSVDSPGLPMLLARYGWPVLIPLALCLIGFLLRFAPRFGPPLPATPPPRRALLEHVRASADLMWREGRARDLFEAVRTDMLLRLRRRHPAASRAEARELLVSLAEITGLPRPRIRRALGQDGTAVNTEFPDRIATLLEIRKRL